MKAITTGLALFLTMGSAWAGTLTTPNIFYAGNPARAQMVNDNFTAAKTAIDDNDARITTNTTGIAGNTTTAQGNTSAIAVHDQSILSNSFIGTSNTNAATANATNIATETNRATAKDALHTGNISVNTTNITSNTAAVATETNRATTAETANAAAIATNAGATTTNAIDINNNAMLLSTTASLLSVSQNTTDIYANTQAIAAVSAATITTNDLQARDLSIGDNTQLIISKTQALDAYSTTNSAAINANAGQITTLSTDVYAHSLAITNNTASIASNTPVMVVDANGVVAGKFLSNIADPSFLTSKGFVGNNLAATAATATTATTIYYSDPQCTTSVFKDEMIGIYQSLSAGELKMGVVLLDANNNIHYIAKNTIYSSMNNMGLYTLMTTAATPPTCNLAAAAGWQINGYVALPNDPAVTGAPNSLVKPFILQ